MPMARPRPSAPPVRTGNRQQAERCVGTWTASSWWSSSCPSSQFHHLGPTALRENTANISINHHWHHLLPFLIITVTHQQWATHTPIQAHCTVELQQRSFCCSFPVCELRFVLLSWRIFLKNHSYTIVGNRPVCYSDTVGISHHWQKDTSCWPALHSKSHKYPQLG